MLLFAWFSQPPGETFASLGRCLIEKPNMQAAAPDLVLYLGDDYPKWQAGEKRRIELDNVRVPNLVGEISDTTLASDLDEKKRGYAGILGDRCAGAADVYLFAARWGLSRIGQVASPGWIDKGSARTNLGANSDRIERECCHVVCPKAAC
jgi:Putative restriction endonuclease